MKHMEQHYSPEQAAELLSVNKHTIYKWIRIGRIERVRKLSPKLLRIPESALTAALNIMDQRTRDQEEYERQCN